MVTEVLARFRAKFDAFRAAHQAAAAALTDAQGFL